MWLLAFTNFLSGFFHAGPLLFPTTYIWSQLLPLDGIRCFTLLKEQLMIFAVLFLPDVNLEFSLSVFCLFVKQICHRDLKLENTLLDGSPAPRLKICDFGYSKVLLFNNSNFIFYLITIVSETSREVDLL